MRVGTFRVRRLVPVVALASTRGCVGACQSAAAELNGAVRAGDRRGRHRARARFGDYELIQAPAVGRSGSQVVVGTAGG